MCHGERFDAHLQRLGLELRSHCVGGGLDYCFGSSAVGGLHSISNCCQWHKPGIQTDNSQHICYSYSIQIFLPTLGIF